MLMAGRSVASACCEAGRKGVAVFFLGRRAQRGLAHALDRLACALYGHDLSWSHAVAQGVTSRPLCRRCGR